LNIIFFQDIGAGKGKYYAVNFPLRDGIDDDSYESIFKPVSLNNLKQSDIYMFIHKVTFLRLTGLNIDSYESSSIPSRSGKLTA
jgi:hypothetical protein